MVLTGRLIKKKYPGCKVAFIGPCAAKKLEAGRKSIRSDIDFVLTFEEVMGMFEAKGVDFTKLEEHGSMHGASGDGRGFAISGGVAEAVVNCIKELKPECEIKTERAEGLENCKKLLTMAKQENTMDICWKVWLVPGDVWRVPERYSQSKNQKLQ